jgi:hypothetical protein
VRFIQAQARLMLSPDLRAATSQIAHIAQHDAHAGFRRGPPAHTRDPLGTPSGPPRGLGTVLVDISSLGRSQRQNDGVDGPVGHTRAALQNSPDFPYLDRFMSICANETTSETTQLCGVRQSA